MNRITDELFSLQDKKYRDMQVKIIPNIDSESIIGVRTPELRNKKKKMVKENNYFEFLNNLPHKYFDENQLHAFIVSEIKDYDECISYVNKFLPYVDNWATCDQMSPKAFKKNTDILLDEINDWLNSKELYTVRFAIGCLMQYYLDERFDSKYLKMVSKVKSDEYYLQMMIAWYFATALAKQYDATIPYIENKKLSKWIHNKTIQKSIESYRISQDKKDYLRTLKIK